jgi:hypothetical protein
MSRSVLSKKIGFLPAILMIAITLTAATATVMIYRQVNISMKIDGVWGLAVRGIDHSTELTSIDFGSLQRGKMKTYPTTPPTDTYLIVDPGDYDVWLSWNITGFPTDCTIKVFIRRGDVSWIELTKGSIYENKLSPGDGTTATSRAEWYIEVTVGPSAAFNTYSPVLTWNAHSSATG